jgi:hypothetical protein
MALKPDLVGGLTVSAIGAILTLEPVEELDLGTGVAVVEPDLIGRRAILAGAGVTQMRVGAAIIRIVLRVGSQRSGRASEQRRSGSDGDDVLTPYNLQLLVLAFRLQLREIGDRIRTVRGTTGPRPRTIPMALSAVVIFVLGAGAC